MADLLQSVDTWFLILMIMVIGGAFLFMVRRSLSSFDRTIDKFDRLFEKVFERHDAFERRLSRIEGEHAVRHEQG